jgi:hypothetical protein
VLVRGDGLVEPAGDVAFGGRGGFADSGGGFVTLLLSS